MNDEDLDKMSIREREGWLNLWDFHNKPDPGSAKPIVKMLLVTFTVYCAILFGLFVLTLRFPLLIFLTLPAALVALWKYSVPFVDMLWALLYIWLWRKSHRG